MPRAPLSGARRSFGLLVKLLDQFRVAFLAFDLLIALGDLVVDNLDFQNQTGVVWILYVPVEQWLSPGLQFEFSLL